MMPRHTQSGVALISALLIVALVAGIAVELSWRFGLSLSRSANVWHGMLARSQLQGAEAIAMIFLRHDMKDTTFDHLGEHWASEQTFPSDEGWVKGLVVDAQGKFNLNLLAQKKNHSSENASLWQKYTSSQRRFIRLLQTVPLSEGEVGQSLAIEITEAVIDWLDVDNSVTGSGGAESNYYQQLEPSYTIRNGLMKSVSELSMIRGVTPEIYQGLLPNIIALPATAKLNVNTLSENMIRTLNSQQELQPIAIADAQLLREKLEAGGFEKVEDFKNDADVVSLIGVDDDNASLLDTSDLSVTSDYFILYGEALVGDHIRRSKSLLYRGEKDVSVVRRTDGNF